MKDPEPKVFLVDFADFAIIYEIKFYMVSHQNYNKICDAIRTNIWYEFKRQKITIPFPIRTLEINRKRPCRKPHEEHDQAQAPFCEDEPLFACLTSEQLGRSHPRIAHGPLRARRTRSSSRARRGRRCLSCSMGRPQVSVSQNGSDDPRWVRCGWAIALAKCRSSPASSGRRPCRAEDDCEVMEIAKPAMAAVLRDAPECRDATERTARDRKMETEGLLKDAGQTMAEEKKAQEYRATFLRRLRSVFEL